MTVKVVVDRDVDVDREVVVDLVYTEKLVHIQVDCEVVGDREGCR